MKLLIVDWLGRGGIAECSAALAIEAQRAGANVSIVTRPARDLAMVSAARVHVSPHRRSALSSHWALVGEASRVIHEERPDVVVVQNYVVAAVERKVLAAVRSVGGRGVLVVHDHQMHSPLAGSNVGLVRLAREAETIVAHTHFVGNRVEALSGRRVQVIPMPMPIHLLGLEGGVSPFRVQEGTKVAIHFGVLKRGYKGSSLVAEVAAVGVPGWEFVVVGVGAPRGPGLTTVPGFLGGADLVEGVRRSAATLLPYRMASQSAAVLLAQTLGSVAVATSVGGVPEQIRSGRNGILLRPGSSAAEWRSALLELRPEVLSELAQQAQSDVSSAHEAFASWARSLISQAAA